MSNGKANGKAKGARLAPGSQTEAIRQKLLLAYNTLNSQFIERSDPLWGAFLGLLSRKHCLLIGPKGTTKSLMVDKVSQVVSGLVFFEAMVSKHSKPEDLYGAIKLSGLKHDQYRRNIDGMMPTCHVPFLDETFRASGSLLDTLLAMLDERRIFRNGDEMITTPIVAAFGASNTFPDDGELEAFKDRWVLRYTVRNIVDPDNFGRLIDLEDIEGAAGTLDISELEQAWGVVDAVDKSGIRDLMKSLWNKLRLAGYEPSDRRWREAVKVMKANAFLDGRDKLNETDLAPLQHVLWDKIPDIEKVGKIILEMVSPDMGTAMDLLAKAVEIHKEAMSTRDPQTGQGKSGVGIECNEKLRKIMTDMGKLRADRKLDEMKEQVQKMQKQVVQDVIGFRF